MNESSPLYKDIGSIVEYVESFMSTEFGTLLLESPVKQSLWWSQTSVFERLYTT